MYKRIAISIIVILAVAIGIWIYFNSTHLLLTSLTPKNNGTATTVETITFKFNHELDKKMTNNFRINPYVDGIVEVNKNIITFKPKDSYKLNATYTATLTSIVSTAGLRRADVSTTFKTQYIPVSEQSADQKKADQSRTNKFENTHQLAATLPYTTTHFQIGYHINDDKSVSYTITLYAVINGPEGYARYQNQLKAYKAEALEYIRQNGEDPMKLNITYDPLEAKAL